MGWVARGLGGLGAGGSGWRGGAGEGALRRFWSFRSFWHRGPAELDFVKKKNNNKEGGALLEFSSV